MYSFFWVNPQRLTFKWQRYGTLVKMEQGVPKRRHIRSRRRGFTQKKEYNIQNTAKVWNQEVLVIIPNKKMKENRQGCGVALLRENRRIRRGQKMFFAAALVPKKNFAGVL